MRSIVILLAVAAVVLILRSFMQASPAKARKLIQNLLIGLGGVLFLFLLVTGRLHWLFALGVAAIPFLRRLLPLIRYVPFLAGLLNRYRTTRKFTRNPAAGQTSNVSSKYLRMRLDLDSGNMDGEVLSGICMGQYLSQLTQQQLLGLLTAFADDNDSLELLQTYLDREHEGWREQGDGQTYESQTRHHDNTATANSAMAIQEALDILGLEPGADKQQIIESHRRLMQKLHPDIGGSTYLATKINQAKDCLIK